MPPLKNPETPESATAIEGLPEVPADIDWIVRRRTDPDPRIPCQTAEGEIVGYSKDEKYILSVERGEGREPIDICEIKTPAGILRFAVDPIGWWRVCEMQFLRPGCGYQKIHEHEKDETGRWCKGLIGKIARMHHGDGFKVEFFDNPPTRWQQTREVASALPLLILMSPIILLITISLAADSLWSRLRGGR